MKAQYVGAWVAVALLGCGNSTGPVTERNDGGTGSLTLLVDAQIDANDVPGGFMTDFVVDVEDVNQNPVSGASVTIASSKGLSVTLLETGVGSGRYEATQNVAPEGDFTLNVIHGDDNVRDVRLGGPGAHTITSHVVGDTLAVDAVTLVTWDRNSQARVATVEVRGWGSNDMLDLGEATIPASVMDVRDDQRIRIFRFNTAEIGGGLPGSLFRVEVRRTVEPLVAR